MESTGCNAGSVRALLISGKGQSSVEYALALFAVLGIFLAVGLLGNVVRDGVIVAHSVACASHHIAGVSAGVIGDVFLY